MLQMKKHRKNYKKLKGSTLWLIQDNSLNMRNDQIIAIGIQIGKNVLILQNIVFKMLKMLFNNAEKNITRRTLPFTQTAKINKKDEMISQVQ